MEVGNSHKEKTIAKNTLMLYVRMIFLLFVGFYTSRVVLDSLGENDYGIYGVVGGVVAMFSIISGALNSAVSRFITFEMGKGEKADLNKVYSTSVLIQVTLAFVVVMICEPVGMWFIRNEMTISPDRIPAALWVLQFSLVSFVVNLMSVPQMASITAHEKMSAYAYIGILDGILRLAVALLIVHSPTDRLVWYSALMAVAVMIVRAAYGVYCRYHFPECRFRLIFEKGLVKEMFSFAGWNFIGVTSGVLRDQGGNILVNIFFTTAMNAARGVAVQLNGAVQGFVSNFMTAVNPQITKSYASGDRVYMLSLVKKSSRMAFFLLFILALPMLFNTEFLLEIWLKDVPEHSVAFVRLFLIFALSESLSSPLITAQLATGNIRNYQIIVGGLQLLNLPVSYVFLKYGAPAQSTVAVSIVISQICLVARLMLLRKMVGLSPKEFFGQVYIKVCAVSVVSLVLPLFASSLMPEGFAGFCASALLCVICAGISILYIGCTRSERKEMLSMILSRIGI
ncbi:MAG: lipopolysaccharide biosynthesis protein [Bacteroidales bacterium]|nr:lipopolysaccharide biosynthesis protein [Bacteroidales bacterium]